MFKKLLVAAACAASIASAQNIQFGGHAALNLTDWMSSEAGIAGGMSVGFNAGAAAKIALSEKASVIPEITLDLRRVGDDDVSYTAWAIDVPVLFHYTPVMNLYVEAGPQIALILSGSWDVSSSGSYYDDDDYGWDDDDDWGWDDDDDWGYGSSAASGLDDMYKKNTFEFSLVFGLGYDVSPNIDVGFRYILGLTNVFDDVELGFGLPAYEVDIQNYQMQFTVTYWF